MVWLSSKIVWLLTSVWGDWKRSANIVFSHQYLVFCLYNGMDNSWYFYWKKISKKKSNKLKIQDSWKHVMSTHFIGQSPEHGLVIIFIQNNDRNRNSDHIRLTLAIFKGQLILKCPFDVFKSSKKPTNFFHYFCPSL